MLDTCTLLYQEELNFWKLKALFHWAETSTVFFTRDNEKRAKKKTSLLAPQLRQKRTKEMLKLSWTQWTFEVVAALTGHYHLKKQLTALSLEQDPRCSFNQKAARKTHLCKDNLSNGELLLVKVSKLEGLSNDTYRCQHWASNRTQDAVSTKRLMKLQNKFCLGASARKTYLCKDNLSSGCTSICQSSEIASNVRSVLFSLSKIVWYYNFLLIFFFLFWPINP